MPTLSDGTIVPSYMGVEDTTSIGVDAVESFSDLALKVGEITAIHYVDDATNVSKKFTEYTVSVHHRHLNGVITRIPYRCTAAEGFGSQADLCYATYRAATSQDNRATVQDGAQVLVACPNGDKSQALIVGAVPNSKRPDDPGRSSGRSFQWQFNGLTVSVDNDGAVTLLVQGATKNDGSPDARDSDNHGSTIKIQKEGTIAVSDQNGQSVVISPGDKSIEIKASGNIVVNGDKNYIGTDSASENLVLGQKLVSALNDLIEIFIQNAPSIGQGGFVAPVVLNAAVVTALVQWRLQYTQTLGALPAQILSTNSFVERGGVGI